MMALTQSQALVSRHTTRVSTKSSKRTAKRSTTVRAAVATAVATQVPIDELKSTTLRAIRWIGYDEKDAAVILDVLMYAQLRGNNQGIIKVTTNGLAKDPEAKPMKITH